MSRASEWKEEAEAAEREASAARSRMPEPCRILGIGEIARIAERGARPEILEKATEITKASDALHLAKWIIDTFGEEPRHADRE